MENALKQAVYEIWDHRKRILQFVAAATLFAFVLSFALPNQYRAMTTILPESGQSKASTLGGLADLAALAGVSTNEGKISKLYPTILTSETILQSILYNRYVVAGNTDSVDLIQFWGLDRSNPTKALEQGIAILRARLDASVDFRTDVVTVTVVMESPELAAETLNRLVHAMDRFLRESKRTNASEQRSWIGTRLIEVKDELSRAENNLKGFREKNRRILDSPQLLLEQDRLARQVQINSTVYVELTKQYEIARIEELKNIPLVNVLDPARPPAAKHQPKHLLIVATTLGISLLAAIFYVAFRKQFIAMVLLYLPYLPSRRTSADRKI
jgi:uncharacterized protein involved in exopolysaccharide biosynthesis